jgi:hypothetical protein
VALLHVVPLALVLARHVVDLPVLLLFQRELRPRASCTHVLELARQSAVLDHVRVELLDLVAVAVEQRAQILGAEEVVLVLLDQRLVALGLDVGHRRK